MKFCETFRFGQIDSIKFQLPRFKEKNKMVNPITYFYLRYQDVYGELFSENTFCCPNCNIYLLNLRFGCTFLSQVSLCKWPLEAFKMQPNTATI